MINPSAMLDRNYLDQLFYFSLKKTGNPIEAEELAQEIAYEALVSLSKGREPEHFDRWMWGVARRRYARWVRCKELGRSRFSLTSFTDFANLLHDPSEGPEEACIHSEQLALLQRELALLSRDYREILVAYYFNSQKLADIACSLGLPEGTIKRKLFEIRKHLKEGMHMARPQGQRSYAPENISFSKSGCDGSDGSPWSLINRSIPKNILLEAYNNPCTIEDLSLALGIAAPYMEEEVELLTRGTLLKRLENNQVETDFIILDRDMQLDQFHTMEQTSEVFCPLMLRLLDDALSSIRAIGFMGHDMPSNELYWLLLPMAMDFIAGRVRSDKQVPNSYTPRPQGGKWDIMGYESCELPYNIFVGLNGSGSFPPSFSAYKINLDNLWNRAGEMGKQDVLLVADILRQGRTKHMLSAPENATIDRLVSQGFLAYDGEAVVTTFPVFNQSQKQEWQQLMQIFEQTLTGKAYSIIAELFDTYVQRIQKGVPARLERQAKFVAGDSLCHMRMMLLRHALKTECIVMPENVEKSTLAMYMDI